MKHNEKGKFYLGVVLVAAPALWMALMGFNVWYLVVVLLGLVLMVMADYKFTK